jgi:type II secretory pathway pseudopilin PulG
MMRRRRGMGIVGVAATTAVVAGTAGAVRHHQEQKYAGQAAEQQAGQQAAYDQGVMEAQQAAAAQAAAAPVAPAAPAGIDMEQLKQLGDLHTAGILSDEEFAAAKAKLLA